MDPLAGSSWSQPRTVEGFSKSPPNDRLMRVAADELDRRKGGRAVDIGCGAGRNAVPLARLGWAVIGLDLSWPMAAAAAERAVREKVTLDVVLAPMEALPLRSHSADLVVAHGIWNLAPSSSVFRAAIREAARVARPGALCFVFTFSRHTLLPEARPVAGERFVFTDFSGGPQCFLTEEELVDEMAAAGFAPDPHVPLIEHNLPRPGAVRSGAPVIYEGGFRVQHPGR
ncbi:MAG: methyltransferase domain-containing protein [Acidobacteria bacterium]|nr:methyltransferase domain-containing protein [Acidobacteriota bacterium]